MRDAQQFRPRPFTRLLLPSEDGARACDRERSGIDSSWRLFTLFKSPLGRANSVTQPCAGDGHRQALTATVPLARAFLRFDQDGIGDMAVNRLTGFDHHIDVIGLVGTSDAVEVLHRIKASFREFEFFEDWFAQ